MHLTTGKVLHIDRNTELLGDAVDVLNVEMNESVRSRVTLVLREVDVDVSSCNGNEPRKAGLELMLPFLLEPEPLVPDDSARGVLSVENRNDLLVHPPRLPRAWEESKTNPGPSVRRAISYDGSRRMPRGDV